MSVYPDGLDTTFPGYPYVDYIEYIDADQANSWVEAMQSTEITLGYGTPGTQYNPLYSRWYQTTYDSVALRLDALENQVVHGIRLNTQDSLIQSVGYQNKAGSSGLAADASHIHSDGVDPRSLLPIGAIIMWGAGPNTFPSGYLQCNGQLVSTSTYSALFGILGYTHGGSGGTFALPNFNDCFPIGVNTKAAKCGDKGGSRKIEIHHLPSHNHPDSGHAHQSYIFDGTPPGTKNTDYQVMYLDPSSYANLELVAGPAPPGPNWGLGCSWSPGSDREPGHQNHTNVSSAASGNCGNGDDYDQPYCGIYFLIRAQ